MSEAGTKYEKWRSELLETRKKNVKLWEDHFKERERQKENSKPAVSRGCGFSDSGIVSPGGANDFEEIYETLLITGELDLPGEWD
jgi:hypothetical protein